MHPVNRMTLRPVWRAQCVSATMILLFVAMPVTSTLYLILEEEGSALGVAVDFLAMVIVAALLLFVIPLPSVVYRHGPPLFCRGWAG